jgi:hypothetical protein
VAVNEVVVGERRRKAWVLGRSSRRSRSNSIMLRGESRERGEEEEKGWKLSCAMIVGDGGCGGDSVRRKP